MKTKLGHFYMLRNRGIAIRKALQMANIDVLGGLQAAGWLIVAFYLTFLIDAWAEYKAEERAAPHRAQAEENLRAFNHVMQGKPLLVVDEWRALMTCKAMEVKL